jgi:tetratricopeptide (TPR) repeat protein
VALFIERAVAAGTSRLQLERDLPAIVALVQQLDGLPLAIELAAAWTRVLPPRDILKRLERGDDVVAASADRHPARRHHSLAEAIASSWKRLGQSEQQALVACARFDGPFTMAAAEQVIAAATTGDPTPAIERVVSLRDKSLLQFDGTHLRLLVSIRDFVRSCVDTGTIDVDTVAINSAFVAAVVAVAERFVAAHFLLNAETDSDIHVLAPREHQHLLAALDLCSKTRSAPWRHRAVLLIATHELHSTPLPDLHALTAHIDAHAGSVGEGTILDDETLLLLLLLCAHSAAIAVGRPRVATERQQQFEQRVGARLGVLAYARLRSGIAARSAGDVEAAERCHAEVAQVLNDSEQPFTRLRGVNLACQGRLCCDRGDVDAAWEANTAGAIICDSVGEGWLAALARANLAQLECERGRHDDAASMLERALSHLQASAERKYIAVYAAIYAGVCIERGHINDATRWLGLAHRTFDPVESGIAVEVYALTAMAAALSGDPSAAQDAVLRVREADARAASPITARIRVFAEGVVAVCAADRTTIDDAVDRWRTHAARFGVDDLTTQGPPWPQPLQHLDVRASRRLFLRALDCARAHVTLSAAPSAAAAPQRLRVGPDVMWFVVDTQQEDLARKGAMRRILQALVTAHTANPGIALSADALVAAGWPGERVLPEAASTRLRTAISALRKLGLRDIIQTRDDGYILAATVVIEQTALSM